MAKVSPNDPAVVESIPPNESADVALYVTANSFVPSVLSISYTTLGNSNDTSLMLTTFLSGVANTILKFAGDDLK